MLSRRLLDALEQELERHGSHRRPRLVHGGEQDAREAGDVAVVVADDRHIAGHVDAGLIEAGEQAGRDEVVGGEHGRRQLGLGQQHLGGVSARLFGEVTLDDGRRPAQPLLAALRSGTPRDAGARRPPRRR